jgi:hypothetical protein
VSAKSLIRGIVPEKSFNRKLARYLRIAFATFSSYFTYRKQCSPRSISRNLSRIPPRGVAARICSLKMRV